MVKNFKELISEYKIVIPMIQRDYAQGRTEEESKAKKFLDAIIKGVEQNGLNLDFIYGKIEKDDKKFIPLDGQQRLTTLFLIYWFISLENEYLDYLQNFSYEVRSSTKDFLKQLTNEKNWNKLKKADIKNSIENANWFFLSWKNDPSIKSILNMLDLIEKKFKDKNISIDDLDKKITFEFLNLDDFNLTDELYIKMNARGKPLTEFENFKSNFEKFIKSEDKNYEYQIKAKLDNEWLNIFWEIAQNKVKSPSDAPKLADEMFYNFFYNITFNFYLEQIQDKDFKYNTIDDFIDNNSIFDFYEEVYKNEENIKKLIKILNGLYEEYKDKNNKNNEVFETFISDKKKISQWDRVRFYALCLGYIKEINENKNEFKKWKRVTFNLINNTLIQSPKDLIKAIKSLKKLSQNIKDIYNFIANTQNKIDFFDKEQRKEESIKADLILNNSNNNWKDEIIKAENHWYLNGQIGFLLEYSKQNNFHNIDKFKKYRDIFIALWDFAKDNRDNQIKLYQALLTQGDYLPELNSNYTFCTFDTALRTKRENWRKVFNDEEKTKYLKALLDNIINKKNDIKNSLNNIIKDYLKNKSYCNLKDFQDKFLYALISNEENIKYCSNLQIRYYQDGKEIYLLKKTQMNGQHAELYTYDLFTKHFSNKINNSRYYFTSSWEYPCIIIDSLKFKGYGICIYFNSEKGKFEITFENFYGMEIEKKIANILKQNGFQEKEDEFLLQEKFDLCDEEKIVNSAQNLIKNLL